VCAHQRDCDRLEHLLSSRTRQRNHLRVASNTQTGVRVTMGGEGGVFRHENLTDSLHRAASRCREARMIAYCASRQGSGSKFGQAEGSRCSDAPEEGHNDLVDPARHHKLFKRGIDSGLNQYKEQAETSAHNPGSQYAASSKITTSPLTPFRLCSREAIFCTRHRVKCT